MTREEAIDIEVKSAMAWKPADMPEYMVIRAAAETIAVYVALGMLKLDEPKSARQTFIDAMVSLGYWSTSSGMRDALTAFDLTQKSRAD